MTVRVRTEPFQEFLIEQAATLKRRPATNSVGMCILSGQLVRQNLEEYLDREGIPITPLAEFTTVESLSSDILSPTDVADQMLADSVRDRLVLELLRAADPTGDTISEAAAIETDTTLRASEADALQELAERLPYEDEEVRETLINELNDYYRWTDASTDTAPAIRDLSRLENRFAQLKSNRNMSAFKAIEQLIDQRLSDLPGQYHQSRSHLVHTARQHLTDQWVSQFGHMEWIAIAGISIFDNPTIRLLSAIAAHESTPDVYVFMQHGSYQYNAARFAELSVKTDIQDKETPDELMFESPAAKELFLATSKSPDRFPEPVTFLEAPTSQRVVERIATEVRDLLDEGVEAQDILLIAPNAGSYESLIQHAFETVEIPVYVETRRPYVNIPAYRFLQSFVTVVDALERDESITYDELVDPLRLGYCPRDATSDVWPLDGRRFTSIEQELHRKQQFYNRDPDRYEDQGILFDTWRDLIDDIPNWTGPWWAVDTFLSDIESLVGDPPVEGGSLVSLLESYLGKYVFQTVGHERAVYEGPAVDTTRSVLTETHPTSEAERIRADLESVGSYYDQIRRLFNVDPSWGEVTRALSAGLGGKSYGQKHLDQHAIRVVDAGNAYFREAQHVYLLGMDADEFPGEAPTSTFLHNDLRQAVHESARTGEAPHHHLDSRSTQYGQAVDFYQAGLMTATEEAEITLCHTYRDERGNNKAWSPFVDLFDLKEDEPLVDRPVERVEVGDWLPKPRTTSESWVDVARRTAPRERLRTLLYQSYRDHPESDPPITEAELQEVAGYVPQVPLQNLILPRLERYHTPPATVSITPDEPAFNEVGLDDVTGSPHHPHELDLQGQCGLKYYYYQFLYNFTGDSPTRADIPKYYASSPHWRLGQLPYIVRENYADPRYVAKWREIIQELLPQRQSNTDGLAQFDSTQDIRDWVLSQDSFDDYDLNTIYPNLVGEWELVNQERQHGVKRMWSWRDGGILSIDSESLQVPAYRVDTVTEGESEYRVPIFFTRFSRRARSVMKACFDYDDNVWDFEEQGNSLCIECNRGDECTYHSKYVIDSRMLAGYEHENQLDDASVPGVGFQEQYAGPTYDDGQRVIAIRTGITNKFHPGDGFGDSVFEVLAIRGYKQDWESKVADWGTTIANLIAELETESTVELSANPRLVDTDECLNCVYRNLCAVPDRDVIHQ